MLIGVDVMGSGIDPQEASHAIQDAVLSTGARIELLATEEIAPALKASLATSSAKDRITLRIQESHIKMDDAPSKAVLEKQDSTLVYGIQALSRGAYDALVTLGSTGAVIAASTLYLPRIQGIGRPFLLAALPSQNGTLRVADVGGTVNPKLSFFKDMAGFSIALSYTDKRDAPVRFGLLNIGEEATKGTGIHQRAFSLLADLAHRVTSAGQPAVFLGNIEPIDAFSGPVDVLITDGFTGNIFLKTAEGTARFILNRIEGVANRANFSLGLVGNTFDYANYPGAIVAGVDRILIKCHSYSSGKALKNGIEHAFSMHQEKLLPSIKRNMVSLL